MGRCGAWRWWDGFESREVFLRCVLHLTSACGLDGPREGPEEGGGPIGQAHQAIPYFPQALEYSVGIRAPLSPPARQPTAEAGNADTTTSSVAGQASLASLHSSICYVEMRPGLPHPDSPPTHSSTPNKDSVRPEPVWGEWRQEMVTPPRLGQALPRAAHYQAEIAQPRLLRCSFLPRPPR